MISIKVEIDPILKGLNKSAVILIIKNVLESEGIQDASISFIFGSDELLSGLKKEFFNKNQWTDVIAFRMNDYEEEVVEGEIYISIPRAKENANKFNEPFAKEIGRLIIHGGLHLLNYDDQTTVDKKVMTGKEDKYLQHCKWENLIDE